MLHRTWLAQIMPLLLVPAHAPLLGSGSSSCSLSAACNAGKACMAAKACTHPSAKPPSGPLLLQEALCVISPLLGIRSMQCRQSMNGSQSVHAPLSNTPRSGPLLLQEALRVEGAAALGVVLPRICGQLGRALVLRRLWHAHSCSLNLLLQVCLQPGAGRQHSPQAGPSCHWRAQHKHSCPDRGHLQPAWMPPCPAPPVACPWPRPGQAGPASGLPAGCSRPSAKPTCP